MHYSTITLIHAIMHLIEIKYTVTLFYTIDWSFHIQSVYAKIEHFRLDDIYILQTMSTLWLIQWNHDC